MIKRFLLLMIFYTFVLSCAAQFPQEECLNEKCDDSLFLQNNNRGIYESKNGLLLSPHGALRVLVVFAEIEYDLHPDMDPNPNGNSSWPVGEFPVWCDQLFDTIIPSGQCRGTVTKYFEEASFGDYYVLGDYLIKGNNNSCIFKIKESEGYTYTQQTGNVAESVLCSKINQELTNGIVTANGYNDIAYFDNWTYTEEGKPKKTPSIDNPRRFDYVVFIWRNRIKNNKNMNNTGYSSSGLSSLSLLGYGVDFCMNVGTFSKIPTRIIRHEYAHGLLGGNSFHTAGGGQQTDYFIPFTGGWSMLGLSGSSLQCCNAWDRQRLGWKATGNQYEISARDSNGITEVNGDISIDNGNGIYVLRDFLSTGDALRIKLPYIDTDIEYPEYIWLENHTGKQFNNSDFDIWQHEQQYDCIENFSGGLMAYVQIDKDIRISDIKNDVYGGYGGYLRPITANGFYDRSYENDSVFNDCVQWGYTYAFTKIMENPLTGGGDEEKYAYNINNDDILIYKEQRNNFVEKAGNSYYYNLFAMGNNSHVFTYNGKKKIGISTNPSSASLINMVRRDNDYPINSPKNLRKTYLNGISIEILEQNATNGNIKVRIRFDDVDIDNDVRWCSDSIVLNAIPTVSGYSLNIKNGKTILLDQGLNATRMKNPIMFDGQKIFASPTTFTIQPDVKIHIDTAASIVLDNKSKLHLMERSKCVVENQGIIEVKDSTYFQMDNCASLVINGTGKLIVRRGAELRISPSAKLAFQNGSQNLLIEPGVIIPNGYANPNSLIANTISNAIITSSTTWNGVNYEVFGDIVVESGATLNITSSLLNFADYEGRVVVKKGGSLIIDGSTLKSTNDCYGIWQGIEVWGDSREHQYQVNGEYRQGYLEMKNGATIENAMCAVRLWNPNHSGSTGGIIHATDAVFRNNIRSVEAMNFTNYLPATVQESPYNGWFRNCEFVIDGNYLGEKTFFEHVYMANINGMSFEGCAFSVSPYASNVSASCMGIGAYSAGFTVTSYCDSNIVPCPANDLIRSTFTGFNSGILTVNDGGSARTFSVSDAIFTNNSRGIFAQNTGYATILFNEFEIGCNTSCGYGVYADGVTGFCIEENVFSPVTGGNCTTCGVGIFNSVGVNDVYRNTFDGLSFGNLSYGVNHTADLNGPLPPTIQGLTYSCNDNTDNVIDFCVLKDNSYGGVAWRQGSLAAPAGNTFSGSTYHFYNDGNFNIDYYYYSVDPDETPSSSKLYQVTVHDTKTQNSCGSHYGNGGGVLRSAAEKAVLADIYQTSDNDNSRYMAAGDIVRSDLADSMSDRTELRQWLGNMHNISSDRMKVASYVQEGDFTSAIALARALPVIYNLHDEALDDHNDYMRFLNLYQDLYESERATNEMTKEEIEMVNEIAENGNGTSQRMAKALMMELPGRYVAPFICPELPSSGRGTDVNGAVLFEAEDIEISISPVPATTWVSVDYKLPEGAAEATMTIVTPFGVKAMEVELAGNKGTKTLDLHDLSAGVYSYTIRCGEYNKTGKLVVTK